MGREFCFTFMIRIAFDLAWSRWLLLAGFSSVPLLTVAVETAPTPTNEQSAALEALVADALEHNPELNFYRAEIAAAKAEHRTAATWVNPELSTTVGQKRVTTGGLSDE